MKKILAILLMAFWLYVPNVYADHQEQNTALFVTEYSDDGGSVSAFLVKGQFEGMITQTFPGGSREEATVKKGIRQGPATFFYSNGAYMKYNYVNGEKHGIAIQIEPNGDIVKLYFKNGVLENKGVAYFANGDFEEFSLINGEKKGPATYFHYNGQREEKTY